MEEFRIPVTLFKPNIPGFLPVNRLKSASLNFNLDSNFLLFSLWVFHLFLKLNSIQIHLQIFYPQMSISETLSIPFLNSGSSILETCVHFITPQTSFSLLVPSLTYNLMALSIWNPGLKESEESVGFVISIFQRNKDWVVVWKFSCQMLNCSLGKHREPDFVHEDSIQSFLDKTPSVLIFFPR